MLSASNIQKSYGNLHVLQQVSLEVKEGEMVCIVGPSGAGKSTLLHILGTLDKPDEGSLTIGDVKVSNLSDKELSRFRNKHIGFVFQSHHLLPEFTAIENVCIPAFIAGKGRKETEQRAKELLDILGLSQRYDHKPTQLSGGEQQRVSVARALINNPSVVLADEPSGNLDSKNASELNHLLLDLKKNFHQTFIIVTHNETLARLADRCITMKDGVVVE